MQQTCQSCGFESPVSDRFCRQCGDSLSIETDVSAARTRNYVRQESTIASAAYVSGQFPPSVADAIAGDTERYYSPPPFRPPTQNTAPIKSKIRPWRWVFMILILVIGVAIGAGVATGLMSRSRRSIAPEEYARIQDQQRAQREQQQRRRELENQMREVRNRNRELQDRQLEALRQLREASRRASEAGTAFTPTGDKPIDLSPYEYPVTAATTVSSTIRIPGHEMTTINTTESLDAVNQYYQKKFGKPVIQINEAWDKRLIFISNTAPSVSVTVESDDQRREQLKITILRLPFWIPKPDEAQK